MNRSFVKNNALRFAALTAVAGMAGFSQAATKTWDGGGADDFINTAANWVGDTNPNLTAGSGTNADDWVFTGSTRLTPTINVVPGNLANNVTFDANAGAFTLTVSTGTNFAAFGSTAGSPASTAGNFTNNSANVQTLSGNFASRFGTVNANTGAFVINGEWILGNTGVSGSTGTNAQDGRTNTFTGSNNVTIHAQITSVGRLLKQGTGTLFIDNDANDYSGTTRIEQGAVQISAANALGTYGAPVSRGTTIGGNANQFGRLELASGASAGIAFSASETLTLEGRQGAAATAPHFVNVSGNNTWQAPINLTTGGSEYTIASSGGSLNISGNLTDGLTGVRNIYFDGAANGEVSGGILSSNPSTVNIFNVTKNGTGTWTFSGNNTYNGALTVNAGALVVSNSNSTNGAVTVNGGGTLRLTANGSLNSVPSITLNSPTATFDVTDYAANGGYTLSSSTTFNGGGHVKGQFNVGGGASISAGSTLAPTTFTFENGLSLTGGATYNAFFSGANHSLLDVTGGTLSATGSNDIKVSGAGVAVGQYPLLHYTGTLGGDGFSAFNLAQLPPRATAALVNNTAGHSIDLNITAIDMPKWTGAVDANWDINSTSNWKEVNSGNVTTYLEPFTPGDAVLFDDSAVGNTTVALNTQVNPSLVTANNSTLTYTIGGSGSINGSGSLVKNGTGKFILANAGGNNYTGPTFINAGTLQIGDDAGNGGGTGVGTGDIHIDGTLAVNRNDDVLLPNLLIGNGPILKNGTGILSLGGNNTTYNGTITVAQGTLRGSGMTNFGSTNAAIVVLDGATLDTNFSQMGAKTITAQGKGVGENGAIVNNGGGQNNTLESVILAGDTTFGGSGRWDIRNLGNLTEIYTTGHAYSITKVGLNQTDLVGVTVDPALADININSGTFGIEAGTTGLGNPNNTVTIAGGANFLMFNYGTLDKKFVSNGGAIQATSGGNNALAGTVVFNSDTTVQVNSGVTLSLNNLVSGVGGLVKTQAGTLNLVNPANTFAGAVTLAGTVTTTGLANGGLASSIGQSSADASNLTLNASNLRYIGSATATTDRAFTITGNSTFDASGTAPTATVAFTNPAPVTFSNPGTNPAVVTLTGSNAGLNVFAPSLSDAVSSGTGVAGPLALTKSGFGTWVLPTANTFTGNVTVSGGVLRVRNASALGLNNLVTVSDVTANVNPASVIFDDPTGVTVANNFKTTGGGGGGANPDGPGVIRAAAGNNVLTGNILMTSGGGFSTYTADANATLNFAGTITNDTARTLDTGGNGTVIISGALNDGAGASSLEKRGAGTTIVSSTSSNYTGSTVVNSGTLRVNGSIATSSGVTTQNSGTFEAATAQVVKTLTATGGQTRVSSTTGGPKFALTVGDGNASASPVTVTGGKVDLTTNGLIVRVAGGNETAALTSVRGQIIAGYNGGDWGGNGIVTSNAANDHSKGVGYALSTELPAEANGVFLDTPVDSSSVVARYTLMGDATLNGTVDFNDLVKLAQNYNTTVSATTESWWTHGDFTYDGIVDFNDLVKLAQNYNTGLPSEPVPGASAAFNSDLARAFASVPEPSTFGLAAIAGCALAARRRRRRQRV